MSKPAKTWEWFRLHNADWNAPEVATLDLEAQGFLFLLLRRMLDQMSPVSMEVILMLARQHRMNKRTVDRLIETFIERGLLHSTDAGFWCDIAEREFTFRDAKSENISKRNAKVSQKRWQKTEQNQANAMPDKEGDREGYSPLGGNIPTHITRDVTVTKNEADEGAPSTAPLRGAAGAPEIIHIDEDGDIIADRVMVFSAGEDPEEFFERVADDDILGYADRQARGELLDAMVQHDRDPDDLRVKLGRRLDLGELTYRRFIDEIEIRQREARHV